MTIERKKHSRKRPDNKTLLNIVAIAAILIIVLAIGVFIGKTLTMNPSGNSQAPVFTPTIKPDDSNTIVLPSTSPAATVHPSGTPALTFTPLPSSMATVTPTPTPTPTITVVPSSTPLPTITPLPTAAPTPYPTAPPQQTITPTPQPDVIPDAPFYESITPLKPGDSLPPVSDQNSYDAGNGPVFIDFSNSYMGSPWAYPGDTVGVKLRLYNTGPALDKVAKVTMTMAKMFITMDNQVVWIPVPISKEFNTRIVLPERGSATKNLSYPVPTDMGDLKGTYKIYIKFYMDDQYSAGVTKVLNIM